MSTLPTLESYDLYTVGWLAVLPLELAAAEAMLDEEHEKPLNFVQNQSDKNAYTWGRIGEHNVVLASLAAGVYGTVSAATTASQMLSSFPNIKFGLLVGIGAAFARPEDGCDIRLGDIVVSQPSEQYGGVVQFDLGKAVAGGHFERKGMLSMPPEALLKALAKIQARHERKPSKVPEILAEMLKNDPQMAKAKPGRSSYGYQGEINDKLFDSTSEHITGRSTCKECNLEVIRDKRESSEPEIFYGTIASSNTLIKDAKFRDAVWEANQTCICLEMEAAGIMNSFPCIVIRGICDYADSHKNDRWQRYAAATAAAYAKELLGYVLHDDVKQTQSAVEILQGLSHDLIETHSTVKMIGATTAKIYANDGHQKILRWLSAPDPSTNFNVALKDRHKGTGRWFIQSKAFRKWQKQPSSFLWLHGIPGSGKTVLTSTIIETLEQFKYARVLDKMMITPSKLASTQMLLYFFFDFKDKEKQTLDSVLRHCITQARLYLPDAAPVIDQLWASHRDGSRQPKTDDLRSVLGTMLSTFDKVTLILDAVDESTTRRDVLEWVETLARTDCFRILITSRREADIESNLLRWTQSINWIGIQSNDVDKDIRGYVRHRIEHDSSLGRWRNQPKVMSEVETKLMEQADGMFRWVACQLDALATRLDYRDLQKALNSLPKTLEETYGRILDRIPHEYMEKATAILRLLLWSERPITLAEIVDAIATHPYEVPGFDPIDRLPAPREVLQICPSLITIARSSNTDSGSLSEEGCFIQLAHFSVKEYLLSDHLRSSFQAVSDELASRMSITEICLSYLCVLNLDQDLPLLQLKITFPFAEFAATSWTANARSAATFSAVLQSRIVDFLLHQKEAFATCCRFFNPDNQMNKREESPAHPVDQLYFAAMEGLEYSIYDLIKQGFNPSSSEGKYGSALQAASFRGHEDVVKILLKEGADVNAQAGLYATALQAASSHGHESIVRLLLDQDAKINAEGGQFGNALQAASAHGHRKTAAVLLEGGAEVDRQGGRYGTALQAASSQGFQAIVHSLLVNGADVNLQSRPYGSPLQAAAMHGHSEITALLLRFGATVDDVNGPFGNALQAASHQGYERVVQTLLDHGANINLRGGPHNTALQAASAESRDSVIRLLLRRGADINAHDDHLGNSLQAAAWRVDKNVVQLLLANGANPNLQGGPRYNALQAALSAKHGHYKAIMQLLIKHDADINALLPGGNALQLAVRQRHEDEASLLLAIGANPNVRNGYEPPIWIAASLNDGYITRLLLENGADANSKLGINGSWKTVLQMACSKGHEQIVQQLLARGADVNAQGPEGRALKLASAAGHCKIVELLIESGVNINADNEPGCTALDAAIASGHTHVVQMLREHGALIIPESPENDLLRAAARGNEQLVSALLSNGVDVNTQGGPHGNVLQAASCWGYERVVQLLLAHKVDVNADGPHGNALSRACVQGHVKIVKLLLDHGADPNTGGRPIFHACHREDPSIAELLLANGADPNTQCGRCTVLQVACFKGHQRLVKLLLAAGAKTNIRDPDHGDILHLAAMNGHEHVVEFLLGTGAVDAQGPHGNALQTASRFGRVQVVRFLLDHGVDVNSQGLKGSALQLAAANGNDDVVDLLLARGADVNMRGGPLQHALNTATYHGQTTIVKMLIERGADVNAPLADCGHIALTTAIEEDHVEIVKELLNAGSHWRMHSSGETSALHVAAERGRPVIVQLLVEAGVNPDIVDANGLTPLEMARKGKMDAKPEAEDSYSKLIQYLSDPNVGCSILSSPHEQQPESWQVVIDVRHYEAYASDAPLVIASWQGDDKRVHSILNRGADVNSTGGQYGTALQAASARGQLKVAQILIQHGAEVNMSCGKFGHALQAAIYSQNEAVVQLLLEHGADVNTHSGKMGNGLAMACFSGNPAIVQQLIDYGADLDARFPVNGSALHMSIIHGHRDVLKLLLDNGAKPDVHTQTTYSPLQAAAASGSEDMVRLLLAAGADPNVAGGQYRDPLTVACSAGFLNMVELLIDSGANPVTSHALCEATLPGHEDILQLLLAKRACIDMEICESNNCVLAAAAPNEYLGRVKLLEGHVQLSMDYDLDPKDKHALCEAVAAGREDIIRSVLAKGIDVMMLDCEVHTLLGEAASNGHLSIVQLLLNWGFDINMKDSWNHTPLHDAIDNGHKEVMQLLFEKGATLTDEDLFPCLISDEADHVENFLPYASIKLLKDPYDSNRTTILHHVANNGFVGPVRDCLARGVDVNVQDEFGVTALHQAAESGHLAIVRLLVKADSNLRAVDKLGRTPLDCANGKGPGEGRRNYPEVIAYLETQVHASNATQ